MSANQPSIPAVLRLSVACRIDRVRAVARSVREFLVQEQTARDDLAACELALVEGCNNAVLYAGDEGRARPVGIEVTCDDGEIRMEVCDHTAGFELREDVSLPPEDVESGRGICIMRVLMDSVEYARGEQGNRLILRRQRRPGGEPSGAAQAAATSIEARLAESEQIVNAMAEELSSCYESLAAIFRSGTYLGKSDDVEDFIRNLCGDLLRITRADWFLVRAMSRDGLVLERVSPRESPAPHRLELEGAAGESVELRAVCRRKDIWFDQITPLPPGDPLTPLARGGAGLVQPFYLGERLSGTLTVGKAAGKASFTAAQASVIRTFADFMAIQIMNSRLREEQVRNRLVSHELEIARTIQDALIPKSLPELPGWGLAGHCASAGQVGGDFYDVYAAGEDAILVVVADVMGKGIPAALFATSLRSLIRATPELVREPATLLGRVNRLLFSELSAVDMFITVQLAFIEASSRRMTVASAGHCPVFWANGIEGRVRKVSPEGLPIGIMAEAAFSEQAEQLPEGGRVLFHTDGLTDMRNPSGEFFGEPRLVEWMERQAAPGCPARALCQSLLQHLDRFREGAPLFDDQTFFLVTTPQPWRRSHV